MRAPESILMVWRRFQGIPCETVTKGWWHAECGGQPRQRTVAEMRAHRERYGTGGNCFDLALWLQAELAAAGIGARMIGHDLETPSAHVAVLATDQAGNEYLCDLGDCWLQPVLVSPGSPAFDPGWHDGFYPGRSVQVRRSGESLEVEYRRANGKSYTQSFDLLPLTEETVARACHCSQNLLRRPFVEYLLPGQGAKWEFDNGVSLLITADGAAMEEPCHSAAAWAERIAAKAGIAPEVTLASLAVYRVHATTPFTGVADSVLRIRRLTDSPGHVAAMARWLSDERVLACYEGRDNPFDEQKVREVFLESLPPNETACIVEYEGAPVGYLQFYPLDEESRAEYGYGPAEPVWGTDQFIGEPALWNRGLGTRMLRLILGYLFSMRGASRVVLDPVVTNERAIRAYAKCGFRKVKVLESHELHEGEYRDSWLMEVTPETFVP